MDQSGDGFLDLVEFRRGEGTGLSRAHVGRLLKAIDRNNDGKLSFDEWLARPGEAWFVKMDENQDGRVSRHELAKGDSFLLNGDRVDRAFTTCDRNGDGFLTPDEFPDKPPETVFVYVDDNGDGKLSLAEFIKEKTTPEEVAAAKARFAKMDLDHDGFLRLREYLYHLADDAFWGMDRDGDGYVSREEYRQAAGQAGSDAKPDAAAKFAAMDLNRDGKLSFTEFKTAAGKEAQLASKDPSNLAPFDLFRQVDQNKDGLLDFKEFCLGEGRGRSPELAQKLFKLIDRNNDGKISLEELNTCPAEAWFMRIDRDQDGRISESELGRFDTFLLAGNRVGRAFANYDLNGDRFMSFEEFANRPPEVAFIYADNDGDGELSLAEFLGGRSDPKEVAEAKILFAKKDFDHDGCLSLREYLDDPADAAFWAMDQDRDGYVSREEYLRAAGRGADGTRPAASAKFGSMDLNHDGRLSLTEFRIAAKRK